MLKERDGRGGCAGRQQKVGEAEVVLCRREEEVEADTYKKADEMEA